MKKPLVITFAALILCAVAVYASLYVPAYVQDKHFHEARRASAAKAVEPEVKLSRSLSNRMMHKAEELERRKITGNERKRLMRIEADAVNAEMKRVRESNYTVPFDETPLPIDEK